MAIQQLMETYELGIDNDTLIDSVHHRPAIWDPKNPDKKNRTLLNRLWMEVAAEVLGSNLQCMQDYDQEMMGKLLIV